ncbi:hypothetical protein [Halomicronema sp. CCY15110]|uniref:hypothetical protein n=1 Tax=Halomicronema sp. CCY15110 TaxID=2767773 RepID=UPI00194E94BD|nr:hypothetical protein [Halomicronema sp. CCY15110]
MVVEPTKSAVLGGQAANIHDIQGIGAGCIPDVLRVDLVDEIVTVTEAQANELGRQLAQEEGMLSGISTGAATFAAFQMAQRAEHQG